jgi:hypothetical protein
MKTSDTDSEAHRVNAQAYLAEAQRTADMARRVHLLQLCKTELAQAEAIRARKIREARDTED